MMVMVMSRIMPGNCFPRTDDSFKSFSVGQDNTINNIININVKDYQFITIQIFKSPSTKLFCFFFVRFHFSDIPHSLTYSAGRVQQ